MDVDESDAHRPGAVLRIAGDRCEAGHRLDEKVLARPFDVGAIGPEARSGSKYHARIGRLQGVVPEAQLLHHAGAKILTYDIRARDQLPRDLLTFARLQIEREAPLVPVGTEEQGCLAIDPLVRAAPLPLERPVQRLDCDDIGTQIAERLHGVGPQQEVVEAYHLDPIQQAWTAVAQLLPPLRLQAHATHQPSAERRDWTVA